MAHRVMILNGSGETVLETYIDVVPKSEIQNSGRIKSLPLLEIKKKILKELMPEAGTLVGFKIWEKLEMLNIKEHRVPKGLKVVDI